jgi:hypothetical protein
MGARRSPVKVTAKTAAYTLTDADYGGVFTTRGATGAVTFTLPAVTAGMVGREVTFFNVAGQNMTVEATAGELVAFNDLTANSIAFSTAAELIGSGVRCVCDGTSWLAMPILGAETATPTIAT